MPVNTISIFFVKMLQSYALFFDNTLPERNIFYNQTGSDEHIDINSVEDVVVRDNVFFNDFEGSGRGNGNDTPALSREFVSFGSGDAWRRMLAAASVFISATLVASSKATTPLAATEMEL